MDERDEDKTSVTRNGTFCLSVIPFGLCNGPDTFLWLMGCTLRGLNYAVCLIYLADIIVSVPNVATHPKVRLPNPLDSISRVSSIKILCVTVSSHLSVSEHVSSVIGRCAQTIHALRILRSQK